jgi:uncharacterized MnhB-related membrane protein
MVQMAEKLTEHPILLYLIFIMPIVLLALGVIFNANVFLLIVAASWMGIALILFFLPIESDTIVQ